ncbi:MAG: ABC transporter ATP-binding protein [Acidimicrobiia bacterium]
MRCSPRSPLPPEVGDTIAAIRTEGLTKTFGRATVVDDLALEVPAGSVFGFLGPNGSGKTTTIRMLLGLIGSDAGQVSLLGHAMPSAAAAVLPAVGALVDGPAFYPWLSGAQNLARIDAAGPDPDRGGRDARIAAALDRVGLGAAAAKKYKAYSQGMRQRLGLANALMRPRDLLVLDEPTNGMDPQGTREIRHLVGELAAEGTTVFISSHLLAEVEQVCTHVAVIRVGRLVAQGTLASVLAGAHGLSRLRVETVDTARAAEVLAACGLAPVADGRSVRAGLDAAVPHEVCAALVAAGVRVDGFVVERPNLEDTFVELTGEGFDVAR